MGGETAFPTPASILLLVWRVEEGRQLAMADVGNAEKARSALYQRVRDFFETYDPLPLPTTATPPYPVHGGYPTEVAGRKITTPHEPLLLTCTFNLTGQPATPVPAGWTDDGLPLAWPIVGRWRADAMVLRAAAAYESATPWGSVDQRWSSLGGNPEVRRFDHGTEDWPGWLVVS